MKHLLLFILFQLTKNRGHLDQHCILKSIPLHLSSQPNASLSHDVLHNEGAVVTIINLVIRIIFTKALIIITPYPGYVEKHCSCQDCLLPQLIVGSRTPQDGKSFLPNTLNDLISYFIIYILYSKTHHKYTRSSESLPH